MSNHVKPSVIQSLVHVAQYSVLFHGMSIFTLIETLFQFCIALDKSENQESQKLKK